MHILSFRIFTSFYFLIIHSHKSNIINFPMIFKTFFSYLDFCPVLQNSLVFSLDFTHEKIEVESSVCFFLATFLISSLSSPHSVDKTSWPHGRGQAKGEGERENSVA